MKEAEEALSRRQRASTVEPPGPVKSTLQVINRQSELRFTALLVDTGLGMGVGSELQVSMCNKV